MWHFEVGAWTDPWMARCSRMARRLSRITKEKKELEMLLLSYAGVMFSGFFCGCFLYAGCYLVTVTDPPHLAIFQRLFLLTMGLFFGYCTVEIAVDICILHRKRWGRDLRKRKRKKLRRFMGQSDFAHFEIWKKMEDSRKGKDEDEEDCPICLEHLNGGFGYIRLRNCMHKFHSRCIDKWLFKCARCPLCRSLACRNNYLWVCLYMLVS